MNIEGIKFGKILLVEDNAIDIMVMKTLLEKYFEIVSVNNGKDALSAIKENTYDLVLLDINLGAGLDGKQVMELIRSYPEHRHTKMIGMSAYCDEHSSMRDGFDQFFMKPVLKEDIFKAMNIEHFILS